MTTRCVRLYQVLLILCAVAVLFPATAAAQFTAVDLGTLGGGFSWAHAVNNRGQVVGRSATASGAHHAFIWEAGVMRDLGTLPGGSYSEALSINDGGQVVGWGSIDEATCTLFDGCWHGFLWQNGTMTDLGALDDRFQSYAYAINNRGQIVGISNTADYPFDEWRAVVWENGQIADLGKAPGAANTIAFGINDAGQIVGWWETFATTNPVLWSRGTMTALPTMSQPNHSAAFKINNRGQIVGAGDARALLWTDGTVRDLGFLPGGIWSFARDINNAGRVVGESLIPSTGDRAFVWEDGVMSELPMRPRAESYARGINGRGDIVGAYDSGNGIHAILWTKR